MTIMSQFVARIMFLPLVMIALGIVVKGYSDIGDGFSAGVLVSLAIILQALAFGPAVFDRMPIARFASLGAFAGAFLALCVAFVPVLFGEPILRHWPPAGEKVVHFGTFELFTPFVFDIGVFLIVIGFCVGSLGAIGREIARRERQEQGVEQVRLEELP
jgi:multicomponent Na+:H+ antiporter subunit B